MHVAPSRPQILSSSYSLPAVRLILWPPPKPALDGAMTEEARRTQMIIALQLIKEVAANIQAEAQAAGEREPEGYQLWTRAGLEYRLIEESRVIPIVMRYRLPDP